MGRILTLVLAATFVFGASTFAEDDKSDDRRAERMKRHKQFRAEMMKQFDKDGDGTLSEDERAAMHEERMKKRDEMLLKRFDKDGDGVLSEEEAAARDDAVKKYQERMKKHRPNPDTDGDGVVSDEEREAARAAHRARMEKHRKKAKEGSAKTQSEEKDTEEGAE